MTTTDDRSIEGRQTTGADIVISAAAMIASLGDEVGEVWGAVKAGRCGAAQLSAVESVLPRGADGGQAVDLPSTHEPIVSREVRYLRHVMARALQDAGSNLPYPPHRRAAVLGTTLHGMRQGGQFLRTGHAEHLRHFLAASVLRAAAAGMGLEGPNLNTCSACSSSLGAIALGMTLLRSGLADLVVAGGYDTISEYSYAGFNSLRLVAKGPLRPFARDRGGMKVGEGYAIVILERADDLSRRGGKGLARILSYGESADAHHLTQPHPTGEGAARAMNLALHSAGLKATDIDLIAAHATGTPDNDAAEYAAMASVFGAHLPRVPVVAFKSHLSHTLGGAGVVELILSANVLADQIIPPCANVSAQDSDFPGLQLAAGSARAAELKTTMNLSLGFGGANTCMILAPPMPRGTNIPDSPATMVQDVFITGVGVCLPGAMGNDAFLARLSDDGTKPITSDNPELDEEALLAILSARRVRRMSTYVKLSLAAAMLALADANVGDLPEFCRPCSAVLGTAHGGSAYCAQYYNQIIQNGIAAANPMLFAEGVPNAAAAHLSLATGMTGSCQTIIGSRTAGLDALGLAGARIAGGEWDRAVVGAADEYSALVNSGYAACGLYAPDQPAEPFGQPAAGFASGWGAVSLVLESKQSLDRRGGGRIHGQVLKYAAGAGDRAQQGNAADRVLRKLGEAPTIFSSANGTWLDQIEQQAILAASVRGGQRAVATLSRHFAECFSAGPLAAIAAALLKSPLPLRYIHHDPVSTDKAYNGKPDRVVALATDYSGLVAGISVKVHGNG